MHFKSISPSLSLLVKMMSLPKICSRQSSALRGIDAQHSLEVDVEHIKQSISKTPAEEQSRHKSHRKDGLFERELRGTSDLLVADLLFTLAGKGVSR